MHISNLRDLSVCQCLPCFLLLTYIYFSDREIQFFELSSFEPYCQISGLDTVPLKLDYWWVSLFTLLRIIL